MDTGQSLMSKWAMNKWIPRVTQEGDHWSLIAVRDGSDGEGTNGYTPLGIYFPEWRNWGTTAKSLKRAHHKCEEWCLWRNEKERLIAVIVEPYINE